MSEKPMKRAGSESHPVAPGTLTPELRAQLETIAALPDDAIDTADMPEVRDWSGAERGRFHQPLKQAVTIEIDADLIDYFRAHARDGGYQAAINRALRASMLRNLRRQLAPDARGGRHRAKA